MTAPLAINLQTLHLRTINRVVRQCKYQEDQPIDNYIYRDTEINEGEHSV